MKLTRSNRRAVGRNLSKVPVETEIGASYADIGGADGAKEELREIIAFLKEPKDGNRLGGRMPKALLLVGPPGTGKTLLVRATAGEAKVPILSNGYADVAVMPVELDQELVQQPLPPAQTTICGVDVARSSPGSRTSRRLVAARLRRPSLSRSSINKIEGAWRRACSNRSRTGDASPWVSLSTNSEPLIAGRFELVTVPSPDTTGRGRILHLHSRMIRMSADIDLTTLAALTPGFTGADLARLVNKAALLATRRGADVVTASDFSKATQRILAGVGAKAREPNAHEREVMAYHEVGHALLALALPESDPVPTVSMVPRDIGSCDCSMHRRTEDRFLMVRQEFENEITVLLAGRAAEQLVFGELSTYGGVDLQRATAIARDIAARYGMTAELGQVTYEEVSPSEQRSQARYGEETARQIDGVVKSLIHRTFSRAIELLRSQREILEQGARLLVDYGTLDSARLLARRQRDWFQSEENHDGT